ncbi:hypothetical protein MMC12_000689 [Toensbergia leucococca]|nr:hypothetical protein [Toensbergia leucococca]
MIPSVHEKHKYVCGCPFDKDEEDWHDEFSVGKCPKCFQSRIAKAFAKADAEIARREAEREQKVLTEANVEDNLHPCEVAHDSVPATRKLSTMTSWIHKKHKYACGCPFDKDAKDWRDDFSSHICIKCTLTGWEAEIKKKDAEWKEVERQQNVSTEAKVEDNLHPCERAHDSTHQTSGIQKLVDGGKKWNTQRNLPDEHHHPGVLKDQRVYSPP